MGKIAQVSADRVRQLAQHPERLRTGRSRAGKRVTLTLTANTYRGAQPYSVVTYQGRAPRTRYPVLREQAEDLFVAYCQDRLCP